KDQPIFDEKSLDEVLGYSVTRVRVASEGLVLTAVIALLLACAGIYGVTSYVVTQRKRENGIRLALGSSPQRLIGVQVRQTMAAGLAGIIAGLAGALATTGILGSLLVDVSATDALTLTVAPVALLLAAGAAAYIPARRVVQVDPAATLRHD